MRLPKDEQAALDHAVEKLAALGPRLPYPHQSAVQGQRGLRELRPRGGRSPWRALYERRGGAFYSDAAAALILYFVLRRRIERAPGALFLAYLGLYSLGRFWVEGLRTDSLMLGQLRVAQVVSVVSVLLAIIGIPLLARRRRA